MLHALSPCSGNMTITPVLKDLYWLPVEYRINYKILLLVNKAQYGMAPPYLSSLLLPYKPGRSLRPEGKHLFMTPRYRLEGFGKRCFVHAAPSLWNTLLIFIKCAQSTDTFKNKLKTHLFNGAYSIVCIFPASVWCLSDIISAFEHGDLLLLKFAL